MPFLANLLYLCALTVKPDSPRVRVVRRACVCRRGPHVR